MDEVVSKIVPDTQPALLSNRRHTSLERKFEAKSFNPKIADRPATLSGGHRGQEPPSAVVGAVARWACYSAKAVIRTLADDSTRDIWNGVNSKAARRVPKALWPIVRRKLDQIDAVTKLDDLRVPPGNRLHALTGDREGQHAVRVNDQYRIVFRFEGSDAFDVRCTDYH